MTIPSALLMMDKKNIPHVYITDLHVYFAFKGVADYINIFI